MENIARNHGKKFFFIVGIPCTVLLILFLIEEFFAGFLIELLVMLVLYFSIIHGKMRRTPYIRITKFSVVMLVVCASSFITLAWSTTNPSSIGRQFLLGVNKGALIEPNHPVIDSLEDEFYEWVSDPGLGLVTGEWAIYYDGSGLTPFQYDNVHYYTYPNIDFTTVEFADLNWRQKLFTVNYFINREIIVWTSDEEVYGAKDYTGTVDEILAEGYASGWTEISHDDCDGIAVATVSLLQRMGFNAYIGSGRGHWYTVVEPNSTDGFDVPLFLNSWPEIHVYYYFNQYEFKMGQPIFDSLRDIWLMDEADSDLQAFLDLFEGNYALIMLASLLLSLFIVTFIGYPRIHGRDIDGKILEGKTTRLHNLEKKKALGEKWNPLYWILKASYVRVGNPFKKVYLEYWIDVIWGTVAIFLIFLGIYLLPNQLYFNIYLAVTALIFLYILDGGYMNKLIKYIQSKKAKSIRLVESKQP